MEANSVLHMHDIESFHFCRGSQQFVEAADLQRGFLVDDTLSVSIVALHQSSKSAQKMPATGSKRAFALVDQTGNND